jgi:molybdopterin converting factor small subunit
MVGEKTIEVEAGLNLRQVLGVIVTRYPLLRAELLDEGGQLYPWIPLYINGRNPRLWADGLDRPIGAADVLSVFSPIASGKINVEAARKSRGEEVL